MPLERHFRWDEVHYHEYLLETEKKPFVWGENDCCLYPANAILAYTGVDIASDFRGIYKTEFGALRAIKEITGGSTVADAAEYCAKKHGLVEHEFPLMAQRGDLVVIKNGGSLIAGVVHLNGRLIVTASENGRMTLPICDDQLNTNVVRAWSV